MNGSPEVGASDRVQGRHARRAGRTALRIVSAPEAGGLAPPVLEPPDLRVDVAKAKRIYRSRWHAVVRVHHPEGSTTPLHRGFEIALRERLDGRCPATGFAPHFVEVNFYVLDGSDQSWREAEAVGKYLTAVVDPEGHRPAELTITFVDTSDLDPYLPEGMRTQW